VGGAVYASDVYLGDRGKGDGLVKWRRDSPSQMLGLNMLRGLRVEVNVGRRVLNIL
jgi:hypothetical protein